MIVGRLNKFFRTLHHAFLIDNLPIEANKNVSEALVSMRNQINRRALAVVGTSAASRSEDEDAPEYRINIYFLGLAKNFTPQALEELARIESCGPIQYGRVKIDVSLTTVFIDDLLSNKWQQRNIDWRDISGKKRDEITLHVCGDAIIDAKSAAFFTPAFDLVQAYEDFGYQIFEPNVRCELKESKVNRAIKETVTTREGRREFRHLNNGITLICCGWTKKQTNSKLSALAVRRPGVINGLQTVKSLHDAFRRLPQAEQIDFKEHCQVLCRLPLSTAIIRRKSSRYEASRLAARGRLSPYSSDFAWNTDAYSCDTKT